VARYPLGQPIRLTTTVRDTTGTLVDAGTLTLVAKLAQADGTQVITGTYATPAHDSTGTYHQDIPVTDLASTGHYQYAWTSTGTGAGVSFGDFDIFDPFETAVLPLQDAKDTLNIPQSSTGSDAEIQSWIATIESSLERATGGPVVNRAVTERAEIRNQAVIAVGAIGTTDLDLDVNAGLIRRNLGLPFVGPFYWLPAVTVVYIAGWGVSVPAAFNSFARIVLAHLWTSQRAGAAAMPIGGGDMTTIPGFGFAVPNEAAELLNGSQNGIPFLDQAYV
jgi:hypothetical protein